MAQREGFAERTEGFPAANLLIFPEMAEMGKKRVENLFDAQKELLNKLQETNKQWFDRVQLEAKVASDYANKVMVARSVPDAMTAYQEWASRQLKLAVEDASYAISTGEALMDMGARLLQGEDKGEG